MSKETFETTKSDPLEIIKSKLKEIKLDESKKEEPNPHWPGIEVDDLPLSDLEIFGRYDKGILTRKEFGEYQEEVSKDKKNISRQKFKAWLANKATPFFIQKEAKEDQESINQD